MAWKEAYKADLSLACIKAKRKIFDPLTSWRESLSWCLFVPFVVVFVLCFTSLVFWTVVQTPFVITFVHSNEKRKKTGRVLPYHFLKKKGCHALLHALEFLCCGLLWPHLFQASVWVCPGSLGSHAFWGVGCHCEAPRCGGPIDADFVEDFSCLLCSPPVLPWGLGSIMGSDQGLFDGGGLCWECSSPSPLVQQPSSDCLSFGEVAKSLWSCLDIGLAARCYCLLFSSS